MPLSHRGSALLSALFIVTLVAIAATSLLNRLQMDIYRTNLFVLQDKLTLASDWGTFWSMEQLKQMKQPFMAKNTQGQIASLTKTQLPLSPNVTLETKLYDLQAKININNLTDNSFRIIFYRLLKKHMKNKQESQLRELVEATQQWIQPPSPSQTIRDEFLDHYLKQRPPYYPAYQRMMHPKELMMIKGFSRKMYQAIAPYICALPENTSINLNTATPAVIQLLGNDLSSSQVENLLNLKGQDGITNMSLLQAPMKTFNISPKEMGINSHYFLSVTTTQYKELRVTNRTLLYLKINQQGKPQVYIIRRSIT